MQNQADYQRNMAILDLKFGDRMKISDQLTRARMIPYFSFLLLRFVGYLVGFGLPVALAYTISPLFALLSVVPTIFFLFIHIGLSSSILRYMDGLEPKMQIGTFFEPFSRWKKLLPAVLILSFVYGLIWAVITLLNVIPGLSTLATIFFLVISNIIPACYFFYFAEHKHVSVGSLLYKPLQLIMSNLSRWIVAFLASSLLFLSIVPLFVFWMVGIAIIDNGFSANIQAGQYDPAGVVFTILICLLAMLFYAFAYVFSMFLYGIAYKQSQISMGIDARNWQPDGRIFER